jgi:hypothetical protein
MQRIIFFLLLTGIIACTNINSKSDKNKVPCNDTLLINTYVGLLKNAPESDTKFIHHLLKTINTFCNKDLDTTILTFCQLDNDNLTDTIVTRAYEDKNKIIANSSWTKNGKVQWENKISDPYLWINENELFDFQKRSKWVTFTIAIYYAAPEVHNISEYNNLSDAIELGYGELDKEGLQVTKEKYKQYIENFKADIIAWGQPESRDGLYIWYEPMKRFVSFYHE